MAYAVPECKLTVPATASYASQCPRCLTTMEPRDRFRSPTSRTERPCHRCGPRASHLQRACGDDPCRPPCADTPAATLIAVSPSRLRRRLLPTDEPPPRSDRGADAPSAGDSGRQGRRATSGEKPGSSARPRSRSPRTTTELVVKDIKEGNGPRPRPATTVERPVLGRAAQGRHEVRQLVGPRRSAVLVPARRGRSSRAGTRASRA